MTQTEQIALIGFGSQGKAWALNLRDSGYSVTVYLREGSSSKNSVCQLGFCEKQLSLDQKISEKTILLLIPDHELLNFLNTYHPCMKKNAHMIYAHGFGVSFLNLDKLFPQFTHSLLAPKAIASEVRFFFETKQPLFGVYAPGNIPGHSTDAMTKELLSLGKGIGLSVLEKVRFEEETKADLFSEQSLLCSLIPQGSLITFEYLVKKGIPAPLAFMECFLELKTISKAFVDLGPKEFFQLISPNAFFGGMNASELFFDEQFLKKLDLLWENIELKKLIEETQQHQKQKEFMDKISSHPLSVFFDTMKSEGKI